MRVAAVMASAVAVIALPACGKGEGDAALRRARQAWRSAPYLVVSVAGESEELFSSKLTVLKRRGRVTSWATAAEEFQWQARRRCYERRTEFNRDDERRESLAIPPPAASGVKLDVRGGVRVLSGRAKATEGADTEFEVRLDGAGRPTRLRARYAKWGVFPATRWGSLEYRYPVAANFARLAGSPPKPRCR
jgi:hypothetical protein